MLLFTSIRPLKNLIKSQVSFRNLTAIMLLVSTQYMQYSINKLDSK